MAVVTAVTIGRGLGRGQAMYKDYRKVNRLVRYRTAAGKIRPAIITSRLSAGWTVNLEIVGNKAETYSNVPRWKPSVPDTAGWKHAD